MSVFTEGAARTAVLVAAYARLREGRPVLGRPVRFGA
ncbi:hypothetical protein BZB76_4173 [Actinomadura pelletieri DSM 43383]|uniref:Uncharacterized protein n=1 Tax=Actinomadura pelletieri DSM 43383 TaxID=1120940 RepID=A0A495QM32_9ACTN|nr:hypothetical protein BZB76_4173 [Actinomadura pelletieri DSM 43383]